MTAPRNRSKKPNISLQVEDPCHKSHSKRASKNYLQNKEKEIIFERIKSKLLEDNKRSVVNIRKSLFDRAVAAGADLVCRAEKHELSVSKQKRTPSKHTVLVEDKENVKWLANLPSTERNRGIREITFSRGAEPNRFDVRYLKN